MLYIIGERHTGVVKIGYTENLTRRLSELQTAYPQKLNLLIWFPGKPVLERQIHEAFSEYRLEGEWFDFGLQQASHLVRDYLRDKHPGNVTKWSNGAGRRLPLTNHPQVDPKTRKDKRAYAIALAVGEMNRDWTFISVTSGRIKATNLITDRRHIYKSPPGVVALLNGNKKVDPIATLSGLDEYLIRTVGRGEDRDGP